MRVARVMRMMSLNYIDANDAQKYQVGKNTNTDKKEDEVTEDE